MTSIVRNAPKGPWRHWIRGGTALAVLALAGTAISWQGWAWWGYAPKGGFVVAAPDLDFGEVWEDPEFHWLLPVHNRSDDDIEIAGFSSSCGCVTIEPRSLEIPAGQMAKVRLTLDLSGTLPQDAEQITRDFSVRIVPQVQRGPRVEKAWEVKGRIRSALKLVPRFVQFGDDLVRGRPFTPRSVMVSDRSTSLAELRVSYDRHLGQVHVMRPDAEQNAFRLEIVPRDSLPSGPFQFAVTVHPVLHDGKELPGVLLTAAGKILEDIQATPSPISFGARPVGETVEETVSLQSASGQPFAVEKIQNDSEDVSIDPVRTEAPGWSFRIRQRISQHDMHSGEVRFLVRPTGGGTLSIPVQLSYYGCSNQ